MFGQTADLMLGRIGTASASCFIFWAASVSAESCVDLMLA